MPHIFYEGLSQIDNKTPIKGYLTGLFVPSANRKTGDMLQTWILTSQTSPLQAVKSGEDYAICGNCPHRPINNGTCYVLTHQAPTAVWLGKEIPIDFKNSRLFHTPLRIGAYGDPTAIPLTTWQNLLQYSPSHTGYTHNWRDCDQGFSKILMASVDTEEEQIEAAAMGWRTYRIKTDAAPTATNETYCPSATGISCANCRLCGGTTIAGKNIAINVHGTKSKITKFTESITNEAKPHNLLQSTQ